MGKTDLAMRRRMRSRASVLLGSTALMTVVLGAALAVSLPARAQQAPAPQAGTAAPAGEVEFSVPAGALEPALLSFGRQAGLRLVYASALTDGKRTGGASGRMPRGTALTRLLEGSGLIFTFTSADSVRIEQASASARGGSLQLNPITVQGQPGVPSTGTAGDLPPAYAGGQVASGARMGVLGNRSVFDVPVSIVSLTEQTIKDQQARTTADLFKNDASIATFQNANPNGTDDVYSIRGFLGASSNTTFDGLFGLNFRQPGLAQIERVEIIKGPSALLNGQAGFLTIGGNINYVPKRAPDEPVTELTTRYVSDGMGGIEGDVARRYGENKEFGVRLNASYLGGDTSIDEIEKQQGFMSGAFDYRGEVVRTTVDLDYSNFNTDQPIGGTGVAPGFQVPRAPENSNFYGVRGTYLQQEKMRGATRFEWDFQDNWTFSVAGGALKVNEEYNFCGARIINAAGDVSNDCYSGGSDVLNRSGEALIRGEFDTGSLVHRSVVGISYNDSSFSSIFNDAADRSNNIYNPTSPTAPSFAPINIGGETSFQSTTSYFYNHELGLFDERVLLLGGVRETRILTESYNGVTGVTLSSYDESELTPAVGIVVKPVSNLSLYANYMEALESGGSAPVGAVNVGEFLAPLVSEQIEIGAKVDFGSFGATIAAFEITRQNTFIDPVTNVFAANGEQRNRGVELTVFGEPANGVRLLGGVMFIDAELTRTSGGTFDGNTAIGVPDFQARFGAEWDVPFADNLTLTGNVLHTGEQFVNQANTQEIPSWTRLDIGARYNLDISGNDVVVRFGIENLLDEDYWASVDRGSLYAGAPRTFLVSTSFRF